MEVRLTRGTRGNWIFVNTGVVRFMAVGISLVSVDRMGWFLVGYVVLPLAELDVFVPSAIAHPCPRYHQRIRLGLPFGFEFRI